MTKRVGEGLTTDTASVINNQQDTKLSREAIRKAVAKELQTLLSDGQITKEEAKSAMRYLDNKLAAALIRRNNVEALYQQSLSDTEDLPDKKADTLMKEAGLTIDDLYQASKFAGEDYEVTYTKLSKEKHKQANNGELSCSELKNIQNCLNEKIKANGNEKVLNEKETKQLMRGLGLSVEKKFDVVKIVLAALGLSIPGLAVGTVVKTSVPQVVTQVVTKSGSVAIGGIGGEFVYELPKTKTVQTAGHAASTKFIGVGAAVGAAVGAGVEMLHQANRKEKAYGEQGGEEGGQGSVTNKTEAKMHKLNTLTNQPQEDIEPEDTVEHFKPENQDVVHNDDGSTTYLFNGEFQRRVKVENFEDDAHDPLLNYKSITDYNEDGSIIGTMSYNEETGEEEFYNGKGDKITSDEYWKLFEF